MCGLVGFIDFKQERSPETYERLASRMAGVLSHRGPDGQGVWADASSGIALGHRRLAIRDLTETGYQPMVSSCGRYMTVYNGELYNAEEIGKDLQSIGKVFRGTSDTEVLVEACAHWGVKEATRRFIGMFSFALWDRQEKKLSLVRDRLGIKPLYYGRLGNSFVFASELKAFRAFDSEALRISEEAVRAYFDYGFVPAPLSICQNLYKLPPGTILMLSKEGRKEIEAFWSLPDIYERGLEKRKTNYRNDAEVTEEVETLLRDAVHRRLVSDVPLGSFLSGGVDSSLVTALMQSCVTKPIQTFSVGFEDSRYNEAPYARAVAEHLGTDHTEVILGQREVLDLIPILKDFFDEPFADASQIPTYLISKVARRKVTVSLSGDGGDELFAGYYRHQWMAKYGRLYALPQGLRKGLAAILRVLPIPVLEGLFKKTVQVSDKLEKVSRVLEADRHRLYPSFLSPWGSCEAEGISSLDKIQFQDMKKYLPDDILVKVDRTSMAVSLEARVPLLDHRIVETAWSLPLHFKMRDGQPKWLLKKILAKYVPENLIHRPKMGFSLPVADWLFSELKDWAGDLLRTLDPVVVHLLGEDEIREVKQSFLNGDRRFFEKIWMLVMYQSWKEAWSLSTLNQREDAVRSSIVD